MTGNSGLQFKVFTMHACAGDINAADYRGTLPNLRIMPATKAANCGVNSHLCWRLYCNGLPPSMYALVQEMGPVDRNPLANPGDNRYEMHLSFGCLVKMYARVMQHPDPLEHPIQLLSMREVLALLVNPDKCQHNLMESYFENLASTQIYKPCRTNYSKCNEVTNPLTRHVQRARTANLLIAFCSVKMKITAALIKFIKTKQSDTFHKSKKT